MSRNLSHKLLLLLSLGVFVGLGVLISHLSGRAEERDSVRRLLLSTPLPISDFELLDHHGERFSQQRLHGHWSLLFFGYTYCPDICPSTLQLLRQLSGALAEDDGPPMQMLFVSVDPGRDHLQRMRTYLSSFEPELLGLIATEQTGRRLSAQLGIFHQAREPQEDGAYLVDHGSSIFLIDPQAQLISILQPPYQAKQLPAQINSIRRYWKQKLS